MIFDDKKSKKTIRSNMEVVGYQMMLGAILGLLLGCSSGEDKTGLSSGQESTSHADGSVSVAAPGRIEGVSEVIELGTDIEGIVDSVLVREGEDVRAGQALLYLRCNDLEAEAAARAAEVEIGRHSKTRLLRGSREEEREVAHARTVAAKAVLEQARSHHGRLTKLDEEGSFVSKDDVDKAQRDLEVAEATVRGALKNEELVKAAPLAEEVARADAEIELAKEEYKVAAAELQKCTVCAPIDGAVLRCHVEKGELVSLVNPRPLLSIADVSSYRVRAEVDERDVGKVTIGQKVVITSDAFGKDRAVGRVIMIHGIMGRKHIRTGDPAEKSDRDVLEVLIDLEKSDLPMVVGLRVTVLFMKNQ